jgi:hypothetical protein
MPIRDRMISKQVTKSLAEQKRLVDSTVDKNGKVKFNTVEQARALIFELWAEKWENNKWRIKDQELTRPATRNEIKLLNTACKKYNIATVIYHPCGEI